MKTDGGPKQGASPEQKAYEPPTVLVLGSVADVTRGSKVVGNDTPMPKNSRS